jgi:hypothetical protein
LLRGSGGVVVDWLLLMKKVDLFARTQWVYIRKRGWSKMVNEEEQGQNLEVNAEGQRRFLYDPTEATVIPQQTLGHKKHLRLGRHPRLHFSASRSSSRPVKQQKHSKLPELTSVLAAWQAPGPIRIHRLATPEWRVWVKAATHAKQMATAQI